MSDIESKQTPIPVLIVGAGPVGLTLAAFLTHYNILMRVVEKNARPTMTSNAIAIHARTLELFNEIGLTNKFLEAGEKITAMNLFANNRLLTTLNLTLIDNKYNFIFTIPQSETERYLIEFLAQHNVSIEWQTQLTTLQQNDNHVIACINNNGNEETVNANWLVGCDGYHSNVRNILGIPYQGKEYEYKFIMIDAPIKCQAAEHTALLAFGERESFMLFPMRKTARILAQINPNSIFTDLAPSRENFQKIASYCLPEPLEIGEPNWETRFYIHERLAQHYCIKRVFLAGDATHVHAPAGGARHEYRDAGCN